MMKDFFDLYYLSDMFDYDGHKLQEAIWKTLKHRGTVFERTSFDRIAAFVDNSFLSEQWKRFQQSIQVELPDFESVIHRITIFLHPPFDSSISDREFTVKWSAKEGKWLEYPS